VDNNYITEIAESKEEYHRQRAQMPYEKKFRIILELQKISFEMSKHNNSRVSVKSKFKIWQPES
jgi:hypothetical protein